MFEDGNEMEKIAAAEAAAKEKKTAAAVEYPIVKFQAPPPETTAAPMDQETASQNVTVAANAEPETLPAAKAAETTQQSQNPDTKAKAEPEEATNQAEIKKSAMEELRALWSEIKVRESRWMAWRHNPFRVLGLTPTVEDIKDPSRIQRAYMDLIQSGIHPDQVSGLVTRILNKVKEPDGELSNFGLKVVEAASNPVGLLTEARNSLQNNEFRVRFLAQQGIREPTANSQESSSRAGAKQTAETGGGQRQQQTASEQRTEQSGSWRGSSTQETSSASEKTTEKPRPKRSWAESFDFNWNFFNETWGKDQEKSYASTAMPDREAALVEQRGARLINQLITETLKVIETAVDVQTLKSALDSLTDKYQQLKAEYLLPKSSNILSPLLAILLLDGFKLQLDPNLQEKRRQETFNWRANTPENRKKQMQYLINCTVAVVKLFESAFVIPPNAPQKVRVGR